MQIKRYYSIFTPGILLLLTFILSGKAKGSEEDMTNMADQSRIYEDVKFLTELRPFRNYKNPESLEAVCEYLKKEIISIGFEPSEQIWEVQGETYKNILASYNSDAERRLIIGAHYDVCGDQEGADDNASAVAGLLETMRLIVANQPRLEYRIDFVFYSLEEPPFFGTEQMGSYVHAKSLHEEEADVIGMICYEMIGFFSDEPKSQSYPNPEMAELFPDTGNFIVVVGIEKYRAFNEYFYSLMKYDSQIDVRTISFPSPFGPAGLSDQNNYWRFNYPALMINDTSFLRNPHYHESTDTIDTLDFEKLTEVVNSAYRAIIRFDPQ